MACHRFNVALLLILMGSSDCTSSRVQDLLYEVRAPRSAEALYAEPMTRIDVVSNAGLHGTPLESLRRREEADFVIFSGSSLIFKEDRRLGVVISFEARRPAQVFRLPAIEKLAPGKWVDWRAPNYVETEGPRSSASISFMHDLPTTGRSHDVPPQYFSLRFRVSRPRSAR
jgi:hypothetical protein